MFTFLKCKHFISLHMNIYVVLQIFLLYFSFLFKNPISTVIKRLKFCGFEWAENWILDYRDLEKNFMIKDPVNGCLIREDKIHIFVRLRTSSIFYVFRITFNFREELLLFAHFSTFIIITIWSHFTVLNMLLIK